MASWMQWDGDGKLAIASWPPSAILALTLFPGYIKPAHQVLPNWLTLRKNNSLQKERQPQFAVSQMKGLSLAEGSAFGLVFSCAQGAQKSCKTNIHTQRTNVQQKHVASRTKMGSKIQVVQILVSGCIIKKTISAQNTQWNSAFNKWLEVCMFHRQNC